MEGGRREKKGDVKPRMDGEGGEGKKDENGSELTQKKHSPGEKRERKRRRKKKTRQERFATGSNTNTHTHTHTHTHISQRQRER
jgi:hypothetical protein